MSNEKLMDISNLGYDTFVKVNLSKLAGSKVTFKSMFTVGINLNFNLPQSNQISTFYQNF